MTELRTYKFFDTYGFSYESKNGCGNVTAPVLHFVSKVLWRIYKRSIVIYKG